MKILWLFLFSIIISLGLIVGTVQAKPDNVDGYNIPSGRIPQEIKNNKYPRSYFPGTELLGKKEMRITALGTGILTSHLAMWRPHSWLSWVMVSRSCLTLAQAQQTGLLVWR